MKHVWTHRGLATFQRVEKFYPSSAYAHDPKSSRQSRRKSRFSFAQAGDQRRVARPRELIFFPLTHLKYIIQISRCEEKIMQNKLSTDKKPGLRFAEIEAKRLRRLPSSRNGDHKKERK